MESLYQHCETVRQTVHIVNLDPAAENFDYPVVAMGCMASPSAMVQLELPHINILSKMDLVRNKRDIEDIQYVLSQVDTSMQYGEDADVKIKDFDPEDDD